MIDVGYILTSNRKPNTKPIMNWKSCIRGKPLVEDENLKPDEKKVHYVSIFYNCK